MRISSYIVLIASILVSCTSAGNEQQQEIMNEFSDLGEKIAFVASESISGNLKAAASRGGIAEAMQFCNLDALSLTDSLANNFTAVIKRTSLKLRSKNNKPDSLEKYMLDLYVQIEKMKKPMIGKAILTRSNDVRYFSPIFVKVQCLSCHGTMGSELSKEHYSIIKNLYPNDKAIDYKDGELGGIWSINFGQIDQLIEASKGNSHN